MKMGVWCRCPCHAHVVADYREAQHRGWLWAVLYYSAEPLIAIPPAVDVRDQAETLVAMGCSCSRFHAALPLPHAQRPKYLPPKPWNREQDERTEWGD